MRLCWCMEKSNMYLVTINKEQVCRKKKQRGKVFDFLTGIGEKKKRKEMVMDQEIVIKDLK